jgi:hypothetical protein
MKKYIVKKVIEGNEFIEVFSRSVQALEAYIKAIEVYENDPKYICFGYGYKSVIFLNHNKIGTIETYIEENK